MIKLIDDPKLIEKLVLHSPYLGGNVLREALTFENDYDLMDVWAETDNTGKAFSAAIIDQKEITVISEKQGPGNEMLLFLGKVVESGSHEKIICDEQSLKNLKMIFNHKVFSKDVMKCSRHTKAQTTDYEIKINSEPKDLLLLRNEKNKNHTSSENEMFLLKNIRGRKSEQIKTFIAYDGSLPISTASISGITAAGGNIANVLTIPSYRNRGLATILTKRCCEFLKENRKDAYLVPASNSLTGFYEKIGFKKMCKIYDILLKDQNNE